MTPPIPSPLPHAADGMWDPSQLVGAVSCYRGSLAFFESGYTKIVVSDSVFCTERGLYMVEEACTDGAISVSAQYIKASGQEDRMAILSLTVTRDPASDFLSPCEPATAAADCPDGAPLVFIIHLALMDFVMPKCVLELLCRHRIALVTEDRMAGGENSLMRLLQRECVKQGVVGMGVPAQHNFDVCLATGTNLKEWEGVLSSPGWERPVPDSGSSWMENKMDTNHVFYAALDGIIAKEAFDSIVAGFNIASLPEDVWTSAYAAARLCLSPQPPHRKWWM